MKPLFLLALLSFSGKIGAQETITLLFAGDLMQHAGQISAAKTPNGYNYSSYFEALKDEISQADIAVANLEVTLGGKPYTGYPQFSAPDEYLYAIKEAGFDVLLTANNHCLDRRQKGLERTVFLLDSLRLQHLGTYKDRCQRLRSYPLIIEKSGFRIALLNYTYDTNGIKVTEPNVVNYIDKEQMKKDIFAARCARPDAIIACMHWGIEYQSLPRQAERELAEWMIRQGVDHIIGGHPHVLQPIEVKEEEWTPAKHVVVYSLGNFVSNMRKTDTDGGIMVKLKLKKIVGITQVEDCAYTFVWTSSPRLSGRKNFMLYPASYINRDLKQEEYKYFNMFLARARNLYERYNKGIKEYEVE